MKNLYLKLLNIQTKVEAIKKNSVNPFFKSNYFDINQLLSELKPLLNEEKLVVIQPLSNINGKPALETLVADAESGEEYRLTTSLPENPDPQKMGAIITYYRRYALQSLFLLQSEDDDGNSASSASQPFTDAVKETSPFKWTCPSCNVEHNGKFARCLDCWKKDQANKQ